MKRRTHLAILALILSTPLLEAGRQADDEANTKIPVRTADELPRHVYTIPGTASELLVSEEAFEELLTAVRRDVEADLARFDIRNASTVANLEGLLMNIDFLSGDHQAGLERVRRLRAGETDETDRWMTLHWIEPYVLVHREAGTDDAAFRTRFRDALRESVRAMPWALVGDRILASRVDVATFGENQLRGYVRARFDPLVPEGGELSGKIARQLVTARFLQRIAFPLSADRFEVYGELLAENPIVEEDIWAERAVELDPEAHYTPVVVAIWDTGTDKALFAGRLYVNDEEELDGEDDDGNGFVDDVHGIAFDEDCAPDVGLLHPLEALHRDPEEVRRLWRGSKHLRAGRVTPEAEAYRRFLAEVPPDEYGAFGEDLSLWGIYVHGTHVAGIAAEGNPFVRLLIARYTADHTARRRTPTVEGARRDAEASRAAIRYFQEAGVRVVNMSWGDTRAWIEASLEENGVGESPEERARLAREIFETSRDALYEAMRDAPEILFVTASGNSDDGNEFAELYPASFELPNLLVVGGVDGAGRPASFSSTGRTVRVLAHGHRVPNLVPGGERVRLSGNSMSTPAAANLAAKLLAVDPTLTPEEVIALIVEGALGGGGEEARPLLHEQRSLALLREAGRRPIDWSLKHHQLELSLTIRDRAGEEGTTILWDEETRTHVAFRGEPTFSADGRAIVALPEGGFLAIRSDETTERRELDVTRGPTGEVHYSCFRGGEPHELDEEARAWVAEVLQRHSPCVRKERDQK